jgi:hypothetical protein
VITSNPTKFAQWFNEKYPGAYRRISAGDVKDMTTCGLIFHHGYYSGSMDGELIRGIFQYEKLREKQSMEQGKDKDYPTCKSCGQLLSLNEEVKLGRHKEYCSECESRRNKERQRQYRRCHRR